MWSELPLWDLESSTARLSRDAVGLTETPNGDAAVLSWGSLHGVTIRQTAVAAGAAVVAAVAVVAVVAAAVVGELVRDQSQRLQC